MALRIVNEMLLHYMCDLNKVAPPVVMWLSDHRSGRDCA
jgi:hypothetical protein